MRAPSTKRLALHTGASGIDDGWVADAEAEAAAAAAADAAVLAADAAARTAGGGGPLGGLGEKVPVGGGVANDFALPSCRA